MKKLPADRQGLKEAAAIIHAGGLVAFPTETYYGLAADPFNEKALRRLFAAKKRPVHKAILLLVANRRQLLQLVQQVPAVYEKLMERFWPGPLTLIFQAKPHLPALLTAGTGTVGLRMSSHPLATRLIQEVGGPITATSANITNMPAVNSVDGVLWQLACVIEGVLDGGETPGVGSSTIVNVHNGEAETVREGVLSSSAIRKALDSAR
jgi:L-threonylcarbamoyladenylate synthase